MIASAANAANPAPYNATLVRADWLPVRDRRHGRAKHQRHRARVGAHIDAAGVGGCAEDVQCPPRKAARCQPQHDNPRRATAHKAQQAEDDQRPDDVELFLDRQAPRVIEDCGLAELTPVPRAGIQS